MTDKTPAMPERFTKKPVTIEAFQMTEARRMSNHDWPEWLHKAWNKEEGQPGALFRQNMDAPLPDILCIQTLEGVHLVNWGDWIIQGVKGELYPCKPDIFELTYDRAALQSAQPSAAVSDEEIWGLWDSQERTGLVGGPCPVKFARAILALRPQAVPMMDEQFVQLLRKLKKSREVFQAGRDSYETACCGPMNSDDEAWSAYLAHHGITQRADGGEVE